MGLRLHETTDGLCPPGLVSLILCLVSFILGLLSSILGLF